MKKTLTETINRIIQIIETSESKDTPIKYAVIEIIKPLSFLQPKYIFQIVPLWKTYEDKIYIQKGVSGYKTISTKNIKVLKIFTENEKSEMKEFLERLRNEYWEKVKHLYIKKSLR